MRVRIYSATGGTLLGTLRSFSNTSTRNVWSADTISLAAYAGQSIRIVFAFSTDSSVISSFYVDGPTCAEPLMRGSRPGAAPASSFRSR